MKWKLVLHVIPKAINVYIYLILRKKSENMGEPDNS